MSHLVNTVQRPSKNSELLCSVKSTSSAVLENGVDYKNHFFSQLGLVAAESSVLRTEVIEYNVIVIDEDDDDEQVPLHQDSWIPDLFGTTRSLRGDVEVNGNATSRLLQPSSRLRKLLSIDISSPLGSRTLQYVVSTLKNDVMPLNPYTVAHSLSGSDTALDYGTFCRTPVKSKFIGRLRQRQFPVKHRPVPCGTHYHYYCFSRADRRKFCERFDTGLSGRSRRLRQKYNCCSVAVERLTADEVSDWQSSQRLRDYVKRMEEKEKASVSVNSSHNLADDDVICLSSDSEDEVSSSVKKKQDLVFRCHQCNIQLPCGGTFRSLIREHYQTCHGIMNIDIVSLVQPDGSVSMQVVHVPAADAQSSTAASNSLSVSPSSSVTCSAATPQRALYFLQPDPSQSDMYPDTDSMPGEVQFVRPSWPTCADDSTAANNAADQMQARTHSNAPSQSPSRIVQLKHNLHSHKTMASPVPVPRKLFLASRRSVLLNGSMIYSGDALNSTGTSCQSACDADVICLD